jgi:hypothetical protein
MGWIVNERDPASTFNLGYALFEDNLAYASADQ